MSEIEGDVVSPKELILPLNEVVGAAEKKGSIKLSGGKLWFYTGTTWEVVTSA